MSRRDIRRFLAATVILLMVSVVTSGVSHLVSYVAFMAAVGVAFYLLGAGRRYEHVYNLMRRAEDECNATAEQRDRLLGLLDLTGLEIHGAIERSEGLTDAATGRTLADLYADLFEVGPLSPGARATALAGVVATVADGEAL